MRTCQACDTRRRGQPFVQLCGGRRPRGTPAASCCRSTGGSQDERQAEFPAGGYVPMARARFPPTPAGGRRPASASNRAPTSAAASEANAPACSPKAPQQVRQFSAESPPRLGSTPSSGSAARQRLRVAPGATRALRRAASTAVNISSAIPIYLGTASATASTTAAARFSSEPSSASPTTVAATSRAATPRSRQDRGDRRDDRREQPPVAVGVVGDDDQFQDNSTAPASCDAAADARAPSR